MKILVTGSSGFIGYHLVKSLLNKGYEVVGIDNHDPFYNVSLKEYRKNLLLSERFNFHLQNINNIQIDDDKIDIGINLAAQPGVRVSEDKEYLYHRSNVKGFEAFCNFCKKKEINKIIYASSSSVYSDSCSKKYIENETKLKPKSKYGESKLMNEIFASKFSESTDISLIGLRFFSVYGPFGRPDMAYYKFSDAIMNKKPIYLNNNGVMTRDMTYIDDITTGIVNAIQYLNRQKKQVKNEIFNLGNNTPIATKFLLESIQEKLRKKTLVYKQNTVNEALNTHADITKAKNLLGYEPKIKLDEGLSKFLDWFKEYDSL